MWMRKIKAKGRVAKAWREKFVYLIPPDTSSGAQQEEEGRERERAREPEPLMECSHLLDPMAVSGRKAGDR